MKPTIIVVDDAGFDPDGSRGGAGKELYSELVAQIIEGLLDWRAVRVSLSPTSGDPRVRVVETRPPRVLRLLRDPGLEETLAGIARREEASLVHVNISNPRYAIPLARAAERAGLSLVATIHSYHILCPTTWKTRLPGPKPCTIRAPSPRCVPCMIRHSRLTGRGLAWEASSLAGTLAFRRLARRARALLAPSRRFAEQARRELGLEVGWAWNPVPRGMLQPRPLEGEGYAFFIGRLVHEKGAHLLPRLARLLEPHELHVAGRGPLAEYVRRRAPRNLVFHGSVDAREKWDLYRHASIVLVPSVWSEIFGYVVVEAFSAWRPVATFNHAGPGELVEASGGGVLAEAFNLEELAAKARLSLIHI